MNHPEHAPSARYQRTDSEQTLDEGLAEYYASMPDLVDPSTMDRETRALFDRHDAAHVVFGCGTSIEDEVLIDTWTLFGSDVGLVPYARYLRNPTARKLALQLGFFRTLLVSLRMLPDVVRVARTARRMKKRWPWDGFRRYSATPLREIRAELGLPVELALPGAHVG